MKTAPPPPEHWRSFNRLPKEEGTETQCRRRYLQVYFRFNRLPKEEGTETEMWGRCSPGFQGFNRLPKEEGTETYNAGYWKQAAGPASIACPKKRALKLTSGIEGRRKFRECFNRLPKEEGTETLQVHFSALALPMLQSLAQRRGH